MSISTFEFLTLSQNGSPEIKIKAKFWATITHTDIALTFQMQKIGAICLKIGRAKVNFVQSAGFLRNPQFLKKAVFADFCSHLGAGPNAVLYV